MRIIDLLAPFGLAQPEGFGSGLLDALALGVHAALDLERHLFLFFLQRRLLLAQRQLGLAVTGQSCLFRHELCAQRLRLLGALAAGRLRGLFRGALELCLKFRLGRSALRQFFLQPFDLLTESPGRRAVGVGDQGFAQLASLAIEHRCILGLIAFDQLVSNGVLQHEVRAAMRTGHLVKGIDNDLLAQADPLLQPATAPPHPAVILARHRCQRDRRIVEGNRRSGSADEPGCISLCSAVVLHRAPPGWLR